MHQRFYSLFLGVLLVLAGVIGIALRVTVLSASKHRSGDRYWTLSYDVEFTPGDPRSLCRVALPRDTSTVRALRETIASSGLEVEVVRRRGTVAREVVARPAWPSGPVSLELEVDLHQSAGGRDGRRQTTPRATALGEEARPRFLGAEEGIDVGDPAVAAALAELHAAAGVSAPPGAGEEEALLDRIFARAAALSGPTDASDEPPSDAAGALRTGIATTLGRARAMVALCRAAQMPARLVTGFALDDGSGDPLRRWVEVHAGGRWVPFELERRFARELPPSYLPVRRGAGEVVDVTEGEDVATRFTVRRRLPPSGVPPEEEGPVLAVLDLTRLPQGLQDTVVLVLLLPLGGLITAACRRFLGISSFGYFTAALLAVSFVHVPWRTGLIVFGLITAIGLAGRLALGSLRLLKLPRLSLLLLFIVVSLTLTVSLLEYLDLNPSSRGVLLPMVCLTMMFERFHVNIEARGLPVALRRLGGTILVAGGCLSLFSVERVQWLFLTFPEVEFFVAAGLVLVGRVAPNEPAAAGG